MMKQSTVVIGSLLLGSLCLQPSFAQVGRVVTGTVVDETGEVVIGANVLEKGAKNGTVTDADGKFSLSLTTNQAQLEVTYIGYESQTLTIGSAKTFNVTMKEINQTLDDVVVVGYGVQKKKLVTGATSQVGGTDLMKLSSNGIMGALQSKIPGANITQTSGMPGSGSKVTIRGLGTVGNSEPLYVIDGVAGADMAMLNPSDIESIDVLKDAASAAIYGSRAANGVILVTTKQAKAGKMQVNYDGYVGFQNVAKKVQMCNAKEYMELQDERVYYVSGGDYTKDPSLDTQYRNDWANLIPGYILEGVADGTFQGTDWFDLMENKNATMTNHAISINGGNDMSRISLGYSYTSQEGVWGAPVVPEYTKHNVRISADNVLYRKGLLDVVKMNASIIYSYGQNSGIKVGNRFSNDLYNALNACPLMPAYDSEGNYYDAYDMEAEGWTWSDASFNPMGVTALRDINKKKTHRLMANASIEIQPVKKLIFKSAYGYKMNAYSGRNFKPVFNFSTITEAINSTESVTQESHLFNSWTWNNTLSYSFNFLQETHNFDVVIGQSLEKSGMGEQMSATNSNMTFVQEFDYAWLSNTSGVDTKTTSVSGTPYVHNMLASVFGRLNYNYKERYLLSLMMRADGSSTFARNHRWGTFPSVSVGWLMSNEKFMEKTSNWLDMFKLRLSWGQNGNCNIDNFQYLSTIAFANNCYYHFDGKDSYTSGAYADILPNEDITWETSEQLDLGIDARFLNTRLGLTFDWYSKKTKDWLVQAPMLGSYGTGAPYINGGIVTNKGMELSMDWHDHIGSLKYGLNCNMAYNKNEVTRIANSEGVINGKVNLLENNTSYIYRAQEGQPIGYFYGYKTAGVFQNQEQVDATKVKLSGSAPGDLIYVDVDGDGAITPDDRVKIGNPHPDVTLGFALNLDYKGLDLSVTANGALGQQIAQRYRPMTDKKFYNYTKEMYDTRWHGEGTSTKYPKIATTTNYSYFSDISVYDADYVRIQNLTIGYDFAKLWKKCPLKQMRLYFTAQNAFTFTGYKGLDPAVGYGGGDAWSSGIDLGYYPTAKSYIVGVNLKF